MFAVDDGIWSGYYNAADWFFILAVIVAIISAALYVTRPATARLAPVFLAAAVALLAFAFLLL